MAKKVAQTTEESTTETSTAVAKVSRAKAPMNLEIFKGNDAIQKAIASGKLKKKTLPQLYTPKDIPIGGIIAGKIVAIVNSMKSTIQGKLLHIENTDDNGNKKEFLFPCTGQLRTVLAPEAKKGCTDEVLLKELNKTVGHNVVAIRQDDGYSDEFKRNIFLFEVYLD